MVLAAVSTLADAVVTKFALLSEVASVAIVASKPNIWLAELVTEAETLILASKFLTKKDELLKAELVLAEPWNANIAFGCEDTEAEQDIALSWFKVAMALALIVPTDIIVESILNILKTSDDTELETDIELSAFLILTDPLVIDALVDTEALTLWILVDPEFAVAWELTDAAAFLILVDPELIEPEVLIGHQTDVAWLKLM